MNKPLVLVVVLFFLASVAHAQETKAAKPASMTASLNKSLGLYVFPAKDQKPEQPANDEQACYAWAVEQSGVDPLNMPATKPDSVAKGPDGSAVRGAAKGAVAGAAIGAIGGDAGKGAAIGAALSGGEQQRVGIARAIVTDPTILLCDEPTGDLDRKSGDEILRLLLGVSRDHGRTVLMVTHDPHASACATRTVFLNKGRLYAERPE